MTGVVVLRALSPGKNTEPPQGSGGHRSRRGGSWAGASSPGGLGAGGAAGARSSGGAPTSEDCTSQRPPRGRPGLTGPGSGAGQGAAAAPPRRAGAERGRPPWRGPPRRGGRRAAGSTGWSPGTRCRGWRCATGSRWSRSCAPTASTPRTPSSSSPPSSSRHRRGRGGSAARRRRWGHRRALGTPPPPPLRPATTSRPPTSCGSSTPRSGAPRPRRRSGSAPAAPAQLRPKAPSPRRPAPSAAPGSAPGPSPGRRGRPPSATPRTRSSRCDSGAGGDQRHDCRPTGTGTAGTPPAPARGDGKGRGESGGSVPLLSPSGVPSRFGETQTPGMGASPRVGTLGGTGTRFTSRSFSSDRIYLYVFALVGFFCGGGGDGSPPASPCQCLDPDGDGVGRPLFPTLRTCK